MDLLNLFCVACETIVMAALLIYLITAFFGDYKSAKSKGYKKAMRSAIVWIIVCSIWLAWRVWFIVYCCNLAAA